MTDLLKKLSAPFPPALVSWRVGPTTQSKDKGAALAYIDARDVQGRLDDVCGTKWQCTYSHAGQKTICDLGIKVDGEWRWRSNGAGDTDMEAEKGAISDAFKRAAVMWGIGRYLYDIETPWVAIVAKGKSYVIAEHEFTKLQKLLPGSKAETATPEPKSPPGITKAKTEVTEAIRELNAVSDGDGLVAFLPQIKDLALRVCAGFPDLWIGPEQGSGFKGMIEKAGNECGIAPQVGNWLRKVEEATRNQPQKQAAE